MDFLNLNKIPPLETHRETDAEETDRQKGRTLWVKEWDQYEGLKETRKGSGRLNVAKYNNKHTKVTKTLIVYAELHLFSSLTTTRSFPYCVCGAFMLLCACQYEDVEAKG